MVDELIILKVKNVYGKNLVYPVCQKSRAFAHLVGKKTLSPQDLIDISFLEFRIDFNNIPTDKTEPFNKNGFNGFQKFITEWNG